MKTAIYGYGNLGKGVEAACLQNPDIELTGVFTRRNPESITTRAGVPVYAASDIAAHASDIDVLIICGGSATDLPEMTPALAKSFCVVDSFDHHAKIPEHFANVDAAAKEGGNLALISCGWDPGLFSLNRLLASSVLPEGKDYTFWGRGVSQGHSDAVRRIEGVLDARQYTIPVEEAMEAARSGKNAELSTRQKHTRYCYVVAEEGADRERITREIVTMPDYFADYYTTVEFISMEEMQANHSGLPHGGVVIRNGCTGIDREHREVIEFSLTLDSNPEFTSSVLVAYARAVYRMHQRGRCGCLTIFDVAPADISPLTPEEIRRTML